MSRAARIKYEHASAVISDCGIYRYQLERRWGDGKVVLWLMLNPSTADGRDDDPTIRRCVDFSVRWGYAGLLVGNLFALRATDPRELARHPDPVGPRNAWNLSLMAVRASVVVAAWGGHGKALPAYSHQVLDGLSAFKSFMCLGRTQSGAPRHPLYLPATTQLEEFAP